MHRHILGRAGVVSSTYASRFSVFLKCHLAQWHPDEGLGLRRSQAILHAAD